MSPENKRLEKIRQNPIFTALEKAGLEIVPHADGEKYGWVVTVTRTGQQYPGKSIEEAITNTIQTLVATAAEGEER